MNRPTPPDRRRKRRMLDARRNDKANTASPFRARLDRTRCARSRGIARPPPILRTDLRDGLSGQFRVQCPRQKYSAFPVGQIISTSSRHPVPRRGAYHDRHERWDGMRWTRQRFVRDGWQGGLRPVSDYKASGREVLQRTAKSRGPDAPTLASSSRMFGRPYRVQTER